MGQEALCFLKERVAVRCLEHSPVCAHGKLAAGAHMPSPLLAALVLAAHLLGVHADAQELATHHHGGPIHRPAFDVFSSTAVPYAAAGQSGLRTHTQAGDEHHRRRVAINFFGLTRSLSLTVDSIERNLFAPIEAAGFEVRRASLPSTLPLCPSPPTSVLQHAGALADPLEMKGVPTAQCRPALTMIPPFVLLPLPSCIFQRRDWIRNKQLKFPALASALMQLRLSSCSCCCLCAHAAENRCPTARNKTIRQDPILSFEHWYKQRRTADRRLPTHIPADRGGGQLVVRRARRRAEHDRVAALAANAHVLH